MKIVNIAQRTDKWLAWRKKGITATDAAALLGDYEYKTPWRVWAEKLGKVEPEDLSGNPHVRRGIALEPEAREAIEEKYGILLFPVCGENDDNPILRASFDGIDDDDDPWEIKCPCESVWESLQTEGVKSEHFICYIPQTQHQMLVSGAKKARLVYYYKGELLEFTINRDDKMIQEIIDAVNALWPLVQSKKEPEKDPLRDTFVPTGATRGDWMTIASKRKRIATFLSEAESQVNNLKAQAKEADNQMIELMGEFMRADCDGISITRYMTQGAVDYKALIAAKVPNLELTENSMEAYRKPSSTRVRVTVTDTKEAESKASKKRSESTDPDPQDQEAPCSVYAW